MRMFVKEDRRRRDPPSSAADPFERVSRPRIDAQTHVHTSHAGPVALRCPYRASSVVQEARSPEDGIGESLHYGFSRDRHQPLLEGIPDVPVTSAYIATLLHISNSRPSMRSCRADNAGDRREM